MKIAVVGSGISGLVAADLLSRRHEVVILESANRLGGHTATVDVPTPTGSIPIDTGFIVFNTHTYPNFVRWLQGLGVAWQPSNMSFSVRSDTRDFEYGSDSLNALFAQRRHLLSPRFHRLWLDILRFYREAGELLEEGDDVALESYLTSRGYSQTFVSDHLLPLVGAVWSSDTAGARDFPARLLVRFFDNHGFLRRERGLQWLTVTGGSREYIRKMQARFTGTVRLSSPVEKICRAGGRVGVKVRGQDIERFDHVVVSCHADQALQLLPTPTPLESARLGAFRYQTNHVILHTDDRVMPRLKRTWSSWNYHLDEEQSSGACVSYWMNRLQSLPGPRQYFVTLNRRSGIRPDRVIDEFEYAHPVFTPSAVAAQAEHAALIGHDGVSYCGAYWRNGFHEDGVVSALRVCEHLGARL